MAEGASGGSILAKMKPATGRRPKARRLTNRVLFVVLATRAALSPLLLAGVLGGFTTVSAFSLDALKLWQSGQTVQAVLYVGLSVGLSLLAVALGAALAKGALG